MFAHAVEGGALAGAHVAADLHRGRAGARHGGRAAGHVAPARAGRTDRAGTAQRASRSARATSIGLVVYAGAVAVAIIGPDTSAANVAPWLVPVVWWVGLPIVCLLLGDVVRHLNPFVPVVALLDRGRRGRPRARRARRGPPAVFLAAWSWYLLAYHRPGLARRAGRLPGGLRRGRRGRRSAVGTGMARDRRGLRRAVGRGRPHRGARVAAHAAGPGHRGRSWSCGSAAPPSTASPTGSFWQDVLGTSRVDAARCSTPSGCSGSPRSSRARSCSSSASPSAASAEERPRRRLTEPLGRRWCRWRWAGSSATTSPCSSARARTPTR